MASQQANAFHEMLSAGRAAMPADAPMPSLDDTRAGAAMMMQMMGVMPEGVSTTEVALPGADATLPARWFVPADVVEGRVVLFLHGGGYMMCSSLTHAKLTAAIAVAARCRVLSIDYRLAPEHRYPAALTDALVAYRWLLAEGYAPDRIAVSGDSAGGGLALGVLLAARAEGLAQPAAAVVLSPMTDLECLSDSMTTHADRDLQITADFLRHGGRTYVGRDGDLRDPLVSPVHAEYRGIAPIYLQVGGHEVLLDDSIRVATAAAHAGVDVRLDVFPEMQHVHQIAVGQLPEADDAVGRIGAYLQDRFVR